MFRHFLLLLQFDFFIFGLFFAATLKRKKYFWAFSQNQICRVIVLRCWIASKRSNSEKTLSNFWRKKLSNKVASLVKVDFNVVKTSCNLLIFLNLLKVKDLLKSLHILFSFEDPFLIFRSRISASVLQKSGFRRREFYVLLQQRQWQASLFISFKLNLTIISKPITVKQYYYSNLLKRF